MEYPSRQTALACCIVPLLLLTLLAGCTHGAGSEFDQQAAAPESPGPEAAQPHQDYGEPASPAAALGSAFADSQPSKLLRLASFTLEQGHSDGAQFDAGLPNNRVNAVATDGSFVPDFGSAEAGLSGLAFAIYSFTLPDYDGAPTDIDFSWSDAPPASALWAGLARFSTDSWEWFKPSGGETSSLSLAGLDNYISPADGLLLVVAVTGSEAAILAEIQIQVQEPPSAVLISDLDSGVVPLAVSFDATGSFDNDGSIEDYEWDFDGDGQYNEAGAELMARGNPLPAAFTYSVPGSYDARVRVSDNDGKTDSAVKQINATSSQPPVAELEAVPESGFKPLMVLFDASNSSDPDGTITDYEWDFDGDNNFNESNNAELAAQGDSNPPAVTYTALGTVNATVRVTDNDGGKDTQSVLITVNNQPPNADLQASSSEGEAPVLVSFDASGSTDPGGTIIDYEWDFDGNGLFNEPGDEADAHGLAVATDVAFDSPGEFSVTVLVTDDDGAEDSASVPFTAHGWIDIEVAPGGTSSDVVWNDLALINGNPAFVWTGGSQTKYGRSATLHGADVADWTVITMPGATAEFREPSLREVAGGPAVALYDSANGDLEYLRAEGNGMLGADWSVPLEIETTNDVGNYPSLAVIGGNPALAYLDSTATTLKYRRSGSATGALLGDWSAPVTIDGATALHRVENAALGVVGGNPAVGYVYFDNSIYSIRFSRSSDGTGTDAGDWSVKTTVTSNVDAAFMSIIVAGGNPALSYSAPTDGAMRYVQASNATGSAWNSVVTVDGTGSVGSFSRMVLVGGFPAIAYQRSSTNDAVFVKSSTASGNNAADWADKEPVNEAGNSGFRVKVIEVDGKGAIFYRDNASSARSGRYAIRF